MGIDIGGTFTDVVYIDDETTEIVVDKVRSTPKDPGYAVLEGIKKVQLDMSELLMLVHGTTVGTNTIVQKKGVKVGLITTKGFRDILEIARGDRKELYNYLWKKPKPLVPRYLRFEVNERLDYLGKVLEPLDEAEVKAAVRKLKEQGIEAIAVCFLHSYTNAEHEEKAGKVIEKVWPEVPVSLSSKIAREYREYERTSTTVLDAYIKKTVVDYLNRLATELEKMQFKGQLLISSPSGVMGVPAVSENTLSTVSSGPIAGAAGSVYLANILGIKNVLTIDVGGTTFDVSVIKDGTSLEKYESEIIGYPVLMRGVDIRSVGAGGGTIARVDSGGLLHVGPDSAGAEPGPMCYGLGGTEPTVTDAALVNGLIDPEYFLGGEIKLKKELAKKGINEIARKLGISLNEAAEGILTLAKNNMGSAVKEILVGQGLDPRDFSLFAFGGAGGIFAGDIAKDMNISKIVVPFAAGVFSAWGMLAMDIVHSYVEGHIRFTEDLDMLKVNQIYQKMEKDALEKLVQEKISPDNIVIMRSIDMCYKGQGHHIAVPVPSSQLMDSTRSELIETFHHIHEVRYGYRMDYPIKSINIRLQATGKVKEMPLKETEYSDKILRDSVKGERESYLGGEFVTCQIYNRHKLLQGNIVHGPAIIEEPLHTTIVAAGQTLTVDKLGNLIITT